MKRPNAFTLIELLVVVAIIALLIAILLPSLGAARRLARTAACLANTRSMGNALQLYVQDWQRVFPYAVTPTQSWTQLLMNGGRTSPSGYATTGGYGAVDKLRICPEAPAPVGNAPSPSFGTAHLQWTNSPETGTGVSASYGFNAWLYDPSGSDSQLMTMANARGSATDNFYHVPLTRGDSLAPVMADANWRQIFAKPTDPAPSNLEDPGPQDLVDHPLQRACLDRHKKAVNVSFFDSHAETVKLGQLWALNWSKNWVTPTLPTIR